jgi:hypothetical protein
VVSGNKPTRGQAEACCRSVQRAVWTTYQDFDSVRKRKNKGLSEKSLLGSADLRSINRGILANIKASPV